MLAIFLSYRRDDAEGEAGRLFRDLTAEFGAGKVFIDVTGIDFGRDFRKVIEKNVADCGVVLTIIGKNWIDAKDEAGQRRLDDPLDFVRLETAAALKRDIPVIPVLVHGGRMPQPQQLPEDLKDLAYRNGIELTHARWDSDVQVLIQALRPHVTSEREDKTVIGRPTPIDRVPTREDVHASSSSSIEVPAAVKRPWRGAVVAAVAVIVLAAGVIGAYEYVKTEKGEVKRAADEAAARQAAKDQTAAADEAAVLEVARKAASDQAAKDREAERKAAGKTTAGQSASVPNLAGTWLETNPKDASRPLRLKIEQNGSEVDVYISYTKVFDGNPFFKAGITQGIATQSIAQGCASAYQKPGYSYDNPGVNIFSISLSGSNLVYEQETKWTSPCDGHAVGVEKDVRKLHRRELPRMYANEPHQAANEPSKAANAPSKIANEPPKVPHK